jgi:cysteine protease ATG4
MTTLDISRYSQRFVKLFWDPEPKNDTTVDSTICCLGVKYEALAAAVVGDNEPAPQVILTPPADVLNPPQIRPPVESQESYVKVERPQDVPSNTNGISLLSSSPPASDSLPSATSASSEGWPSAFLDDFESRIWLTYRSNFLPIPKSADPSATSGMSLGLRLKSQLAGPVGFTSDTGWGCMIRSGQSILANSLALLYFGRDWRRPAVDPSTADESITNTDLEEKRLLSLFADHPSAPFSIHNFVAHGATACGTHPGQWFGPSATAACIQALASAHEASNLRVYVTGDGPNIYSDALLKVARRGSDTFLPTLLLVGTRLGIDRITPVYRDALAAALKMPQSVGIAGGRPSSSHYFVGVQDTTSFFYLDPHTTRPALAYHEDPAQYTEADVATCHTRRLRRCGVEEMDPSMLIAFLFRNEQDWEDWRRTVAEAPGKAIFHVLEGEGEQGEQRGGEVGGSGERASAIDEVETFDDEDEDDARSEELV